ncbi:BppU family phage baseplate upper protein [Bacillus cereus]|uniref:BppU family phage baseplate upper protein n=1 Tax=Bacillus cereus TaxID=1396 RepID=UPI002ABEEDDC|nr:BppU family phage baseplate upper protein [Bacillus cereus]MDZ4499755.1 BppU family phage baseplate upper protein [Bacillus cereus]
MKIKLVLDINKTQQAQLNAVVTGRQGDKATVTVNVFVVDGGVPYNLTGNTIYYEGLKPNNAYVRDTSGVKMINATQGNFEYTFRPETFGVAGIGKRSYFSIEQGGTVRASTQDFGLVTLADAMTGNTMSGPYISELEELINLAQWLVDDINSRWTSINTQLTQLQNKLNTMDVVKRSGDTMLGDLRIERGSGERAYHFYKNGATTTKLLDNDNTTALYSIDNAETVWRYNKNNKAFEVMSSNTNLLKKTGDTMTGFLKLDRGVGTSTAYNVLATGALINYYVGLNVQGKYHLYDDINKVTPFEYDPATQEFKVNTNANLVKKTGDTMTGNLNFASASQIQNLASTGQLVFGNSGIWINDTNGNFVPWQYRYSDKMFLVNAETNLMKKTDYSGKDGRVNLTLTADATNFDSGFGPIADRRGNTVTVRLAIMRNAGATGEVVTTLPVNMRPLLTLVKWGIAEDGSPLKYQINTDGTIRFYTTGKGLRIVETFVAD